MKTSVLVAAPVQPEPCFLCYGLPVDAPVTLCRAHLIQIVLRLLCFLVRTQQVEGWQS